VISIPSPGIPLEYGEPGAPLVVVLHDKYGRLPWLEPYASALAGRGGFRVLVPDFYEGVATTDGDEATSLMRGLSDDDARDILDAAIGAGLDGGGLRHDGSRVGLVGFSMGGALALRAGQRGDADAVVAYYAALRPDQPGILPCPVLLHLAEADALDPAEFVNRLRGDGTPVTTHTYAGTVHSFANATLPEKVDGRAAALAFARTVVFLEARLSE
jgi:carboxymethylenebutenolidase